MKFLLPILLAAITLSADAASVKLFNGNNLVGWQGETNIVWRVRDGAIVGGSLEGNPQNEFLTTMRSYRNFRLKLEYKLIGTEGFVNGGVQFRSKHVAQPPNEVAGYQADIGAGFSGCLYDESRRRKVLVTADKLLVTQLEKPGDWNSYEIHAEGPRIRLFLNGKMTVDYTEREPGIDLDGFIALQIHGKCKAEASYRNIVIEELAGDLVPTETEILGRFGDEPTGTPLPAFPNATFALGDKETIVFAGQENLVREQKSGELESLLAAGFAAQQPRFRSMAWEGDTVYEQWRDLNFGSWTKQLKAANATIVIAQFGQMEALNGAARLQEFTAAHHRLLDQFAACTRRIVLVSPMPFEKPSASHAPDLSKRNSDVAAYANAVRDIARQRGAAFVDLFTPLSQRAKNAPRLTEDGIHLTDTGLREVAQIIASQLGAVKNPSANLIALREAIVEKNRLWFDCWRPANWSFVYGDRVSQLYGKAAGNAPSLKETFEHYKPLISDADARVHAIARGETPSHPAELRAPPAVEPEVMTPEAELATFTVAEGYEVNLFASEREGVVKPTQISWDERGRLYVACSPTYPQTQASAKPADFVVMLEDTKGSGVATKAQRFAEGLTMVQGLEPGDGGLYVCDFDQLVHLKDTNGDGHADVRRVVFSGFGIGDTHQLVNSITHGPDGSFWFTQGLHAFSRVETPWGIARLDKAGVWRMQPRTMRLDGFFNGGKAGHNCWGVAFDDYGQVFHKSGDRPHGYWSVPGMIRFANPDEYHPVAPLFDTSPKTTALEIIGTRALPDDVQGCAVLAGFMGGVIELHRFENDGSGFKTIQLPKLLRSSTSAFRPVDVSVGPDGAIYVADWFNPIIGHYQASYADPRRDKTHGRIWRISAKGRAPVKQPNLAKMKPATLLDQLHSPERWTRYQAKRLLFDAPSVDVLKAADAWVTKLKPSTTNYERLLLDVIGVFEAHEAARPDLLAKLLAAKDPRVRAYGTRVIGAWWDRLPDPLALLRESIHDENPRVRLEAIVAGSYVTKPDSVEVVAQAIDSPRDKFIDYALAQSVRTLQPQWAPALAANRLTFGGNKTQADYVRKIASSGPAVLPPGRMIYEMACLPCHQPDGKGLPGTYPPLDGSDWVRGDKTRMIKIVLAGLTGPLTVSGQSFVMQNPVPMPAFAGLDDQQIADVISYVRSDYGKGTSGITADDVKAVRSQIGNRETPWTAEELVK